MFLKLFKAKVCQYFMLTFFISISIPVHLSARIKLFRESVVWLKYFAGSCDSHSSIYCSSILFI